MLLIDTVRILGYDPPTIYKRCAGRKAKQMSNLKKDIEELVRSVVASIGYYAMHGKTDKGGSDKKLDNYYPRIGQSIKKGEVNLDE